MVRKKRIGIIERFGRLILLLKSLHMINESSFPASDIYLTLANINFIFYNSQIDIASRKRRKGDKTTESTFLKINFI